MCLTHLDGHDDDHDDIISVAKVCSRVHCFGGWGFVVASKMAPRRGAKRPLTSYFSAGEMADKLPPLAQLKDVGYKWDGSGYERDRRGLTANLDGLREYRKPLAIILGLSPTGFPSYGRLKTAFTIVNRVYKIYDVPDHCVNHEAGLATDRFRIMAKDCYNLRKQEYKGDLDDIVGLINLEAARGVQDLWDGKTREEPVDLLESGDDGELREVDDGGDDGELLEVDDGGDDGDDDVSSCGSISDSMGVEIPVDMVADSDSDVVLQEEDDDAVFVSSACRLGCWTMLDTTFSR